jgi:hypothetical protein
MAFTQHPLIVSILCMASLFFSAYVLRWTVLGIGKGKVRYRFREYSRFRHPANFWFAVIWGFCVGVVFLFGALLVFFVGVRRGLI